MTDLTTDGHLRPIARAITQHICTILQPGDDPARYAWYVLESPLNRPAHIHTIPGKWTRSGRPYSFFISDDGRVGQYRTGTVATVRDDETGAEILTGLPGCMGGTREAFQTARRLAAERGGPVRLHDDDGEWSVYPTHAVRRAFGIDMALEFF